MAEPLSTWRPGHARDAILDFVDRATTGADSLPAEQRVAVFDNDGTLWCEKPMPIQLDFVLRRLAEMAEADPGLRDRQPWRAAHERDHAWLDDLVVEHYAGDDTKMRTLGAGLLAAFADIDVDDFTNQADAFLRGATHPTLGRGYLQTVYAPMVELLRYLEANGFTTYIVSGGGRDFMRPVSDELYGVPSERVIGSSTALSYVPDDRGGRIVRTAAVDVVDDGPEKPVQIWSRTGRRPVLAAGNSNGDLEMLDFTQHAGIPTLRLLVLHDDADREFAYVSGAEKALERAGTSGWTVVSMKDDWRTVF